MNITPVVQRPHLTSIAGDREDSPSTIRNVIIYARTARDDNHEAIDRQIAACREYAYRRNWQITGVYFDYGSGDTIEHLNLTRVRKRLRNAQHIDAILVTSIDRITRSMSDWLRLNDEFSQHGLHVVQVGEPARASTDPVW